MGPVLDILLVTPSMDDMVCFPCHILNGAVSFGNTAAVSTHQSTTQSAPGESPILGKEGGHSRLVRPKVSKSSMRSSNLEGGHSRLVRPKVSKSSMRSSNLGGGILGWSDSKFLRPP